MRHQTPASPPPAACKRRGPADVPSVSIGHVTYQVIHWGQLQGLDQNGGYIAAIDSKNHKPLWTLKIYTTVIDPDKERDVQDVFITSMKKIAGGKLLEIEDEAHHTYLVDLKTRTVTQRRN
jgi:hypothetical protein